MEYFSIAAAFLSFGFILGHWIGSRIERKTKEAWRQSSLEWRRLAVQWEFLAAKFVTEAEAEKLLEQARRLQRESDHVSRN